MELVDSARCLVIDANNLTPIIANTKWNGKAMTQDWQRNKRITPYQSSQSTHSPRRLLHRQKEERLNHLVENYKAPPITRPL